MRPNLKDHRARGVATMKFFVAFLLVLTTLISGVTKGQSPSAKSNQSTAGKQRNETLRICQGVPIPDGYVIIAYMTSAACPHGAYIVKKQNDYESSLAVNGDNRTPASNLTEPPRTTTGKSTSSAEPRRTPTQSAKRSIPKTSSAQTQPAVDPALSSRASSVTRPRRVGSASEDTSQMPSTTQSTEATKPQDATESRATTETPQGPPTLIGSEPARPLAP